MTTRTWLEVDNHSRASALPSDAQMRHWVSAALAGSDEPACSVYLRIVDEEESEQLNQQYRNKARPTNVLSFPLDAPLEDGSRLLGDLVVCADVVAREADEQGKALPDHWAHMLIHGTLHLLGYDHVEETDAEQMENLERKLLAQFGISDPYLPV